MALPEKHLGALSSLRFGTAPLIKNVAHNLPVSGRLCPFCVKDGRSVVEDEAHLCFDCPLYRSEREELVVSLQGTQSAISKGQFGLGGSVAASLLKALFSPQCRASARAVAKFSFLPAPLSNEKVCPSAVLKKSIRPMKSNCFLIVFRF